MLRSIRRTPSLTPWALLAAVCLLRAVWLPMHLAGEAHHGPGEHSLGAGHAVALLLGHSAHAADHVDAHEHHASDHEHREQATPDCTESADSSHSHHDPHSWSDHLLELLPGRKPALEGLAAPPAVSTAIALVQGAPSRATCPEVERPIPSTRSEPPRKRGPPRA